MNRLEAIIIPNDTSSHADDISRSPRSIQRHAERNHFDDTKRTSGDNSRWNHNPYPKRVFSSFNELSLILFLSRLYSLVRFV